MTYGVPLTTPFVYFYLLRAVHDAHGLWRAAHDALSIFLLITCCSRCSWLMTCCSRRPLYIFTCDVLLTTTRASNDAHSVCFCVLTTRHMSLGLARTIYLRCIYGTLAGIPQITRSYTEYIFTVLANPTGDHTTPRHSAAAVSTQRKHTVHI